MKNIPKSEFISEIGESIPKSEFISEIGESIPKSEFISEIGENIPKSEFISENQEKYSGIGIYKETLYSKVQFQSANFALWRGSFAL